MEEATWTVNNSTFMIVQLNQIHMITWNLSPNNPHCHRDHIKAEAVSSALTDYFIIKAEKLIHKNSHMK